MIGGMAHPPASAPDPALRQRIVSGIVLGVAAIVAAILGGWPFVGLVLVAVVIMAIEWARLAGAGEGRTMLAAATAIVPALSVLMLTLGAPHAATPFLVVGALAVAALAVLRHWCGPMRAAGGVLYIGVPALALVWLRATTTAGAQHLLWLLIVICATDICAYLVGRGVGGPRLAPRISPGKTWAGLLGGVVGASLCGALAAQALGAGFGFAALVGAGLAVVGQAGDLFESALKRRAGVKDSSHLIPGHGGLLDRIDGLVFAAPAFAALVWMGLQVGARP